MISWLLLAAAAWAAPTAQNAAPDSAAVPRTAAAVASEGYQAHPAARSVTLAEALALAERNAPAMIRAAGQRRAGRAGVQAAYAAFIPTLSVSAGSTKQLPEGQRTRIENGNVVILPVQPWSYSLGMSSNVDLFAGGSRIFDIQHARATEVSANASETAQRYATTLDVKQQFFDVLAARESESAALAQLQQATQQLRTSSAMVHMKTATRSDSLRAEIQVRNAQIALGDARLSLDVANATLSRSIGSPSLVTAAESDTLAEPDIALGDSALLSLAENGPAVAQARADLDAARAQSRSTWANYLPSISAGYSRSGTGAGNDLLPQESVLSYGGSLRLTATLPIFNQFQREQERVDADIARVNAEATLRDEQLAARAGVVQYLGAWRAARDRVGLQQATLEAALEDLRVQQQRYSVGGSTLLDVLASQTQLDQARRDLIRARYDERVARAQLQSLVGRDL